MNMFNNKIILTGLVALLVMASCARSSKNPGREYIPDMGRYKAYEGYFENPGNPILPNGMNAQLPPKNSIAQDFDVYPYPATVDGYNEAGVALQNPYTFSEAEIQGEGKNLYLTYCMVCHGEKGEADGPLTKLKLAMDGNGFPPPPSYFRADILQLPEGKKYHSLYYGKNFMGSYATQLNERERWLVLDYVGSMQAAYIAAQGETAETAAQ